MIFTKLSITQQFASAKKMRDQKLLRHFQGCVEKKNFDQAKRFFVLRSSYVFVKLIVAKVKNINKNGEKRSAISSRTSETRRNVRFRLFSMSFSAFRKTQALTSRLIVGIFRILGRRKSWKGFRKSKG